jgi:anti-sigma factor RsiW
MNQGNCANVKDLLPEYLAGSLSESERELVEAHLSGCDDCRMEAELIGHLRATTPTPRAELSAAVRAGLRTNASPGPARTWWMAAAAAVILALGTALVWDRVNEAPAVMALAEQVDGDFWPGDETLIAGGLVWDDLSEEEMTALLEGWDDEA